MQLDMMGLIREFGIDKLPQEERDAVLARLLESVNLRVGMRMSETLSDEEMRRVEELSKSEDPEKALVEMETIYPDFRKAYQEEIDRVREEMRTLMPSDEELDRLEAEAQRHERSQGQ